MNMTNNPQHLSDSDLAWKARAARRRQMLAKKKQRKRRNAVIGLILLLAAVIVLTVFLARDPAAASPAETSAPPTETETETEATVPPETEAPTLPPVTWMNFEEGRTLTAAKYFVYDADADAFVTISGQPNDIIYPASITKLITASVAMMHLDLEAVITVTDALDLVVSGSSLAELEYGDKIKTETLLEAMLLPSGNDAACVLAVEVGRILAEDMKLSPRAAAKRFVEEMNNRAEELGMIGSHFTNADGIHNEEHYTTFADLARLGKMALENEILAKYTGLARDTVTLEKGGERQWKNTNSIINPESKYYCPYALGLKTGSTPQAGNCLLSAFQCSGRTLIIGVFDCPRDRDRFMDTLQLFNEAMGFEPLPPESTGA